MKKLNLLFIIGFLISCQKEEVKEQPAPEPNAIILGQGMDCGDSYLIKFNDNVQGLPTPNLNNTYYTIDLPQSYKVDSLEVYVEYRMPQGNEGMACSAMGPSFTQIVITHVE